MTHVRQQIRDQAVVELTAAIPEFLTVESTRLYSYREKQLPALNVVTDNEVSQPGTLGGPTAGSMAKRLMERQLSLQTEIYCSVLDLPDTIDAEMDRLAAEVEKVLENTLLNDLAFDIALTNSVPEVDAEGEIPVGIYTLTWRVNYHTLEGDPETSV